jgi:hypothetical protein
MIFILVPIKHEKGENEMWSPCWKQVKCRTCGREYTCTPDDDYYNSTNATDGVCEKCLLNKAGITTPPIVILPTVISEN